MKQYIRTRLFMEFNLRGFKYCDGIEIMDELHVGNKVTLEKEENNPHDENSVAVYYKDTKIGYVPKERNSVLGQLLYFGHGDIFEAYIIDVDFIQDTYRIGVRIVNKRNKE